MSREQLRFRPYILFGVVIFLTAICQPISSAIQAAGQIPTRFFDDAPRPMQIAPVATAVISAGLLNGQRLLPQLVPSAGGIPPSQPTPANYLKDPNSWHCGTDNMSKTLSLLAVGLCPTEPLNWCCFEHDRCYDYYQHSISFLRMCDEQFGYCVRFAYQQNHFCADWLYSTHVNVVRIFGEPYKQMLVNKL